MIDHLLGRPSTSLKRLQVLAVLVFWGSVLRETRGNGSRRSKLVRWANRRAAQFPPWKIVLTTLMFMYSLRHLDSIFGFGAPEPLARMYSRSFYRTTWIVTALDAGFASAMNVKPKWLRDIVSVAFSFYYVVYANEADEKLRKYRAFCTVEMLRYTWEKTTNPYIRMVTWFHRPSLPIARQILLARPSVGAHAKRPINAWLFHDGNENDLAKHEELYLDFPGGGFICMNPRHHEERLRQLAKEVRRPVLAVDYCKAPEYPYPYALEECYDLYRTLSETRGTAIGMSGSSRFRLVLSGDSAGGNLATGVMLKILEYPQPHIKAAYAALGSATPPPLPRPLSLILAYPSLNFGFTAWIKPEHLRVLKAQSEVNLQNLQLQTNQAHTDHKSGKKSSPLRPRSRSRSRSSSTSIIGLNAVGNGEATTETAKPRQRGMATDRSYRSLASQAELPLADRARLAEAEPLPEDGSTNSPPANPPAAADSDERQRELALTQLQADADMTERRKKAPVGTRLTMSSMSAYFQDRILTQSMMRAMAILYIGPRRQPDFDHDYYLSPIVAPASLLAEFPPVLFICGEKDPICDDTVIMAGRIREAKLAKQADVRRRRGVGGLSRFGEGLRMSAGGANEESDPIEDESVEDWVQMRIIASVSHGLLQMGALWPEAKHIISFIAAWCTEAYEEETDRLEEMQEQQEQQRQEKAAGSQRSKTLPLSSAGPQASADKEAAKSTGVTSATLGKTFEDAEEEEDDGAPLTFTPKRMRSPSIQPSGQFSSSPRLSDSGRPTASPRSSDRLQPPAVTSLRAEMAGAASGSDTVSSGTPASSAQRPALDTSARGRPTSFSGGDARQARAQAASKAAAASPDSLRPPVAANRSNSFHTTAPTTGGPGSSPTTSRRTLSPVVAGASASGTSTPSGAAARRTSRGVTSGAAMDERTQALLVEEVNLLQRRRDEAVSGLGSSAVHSDDEDEEEVQKVVERSDNTSGDDHDGGRGRGRGRGRSTQGGHRGSKRGSGSTSGEGSTDTAGSSGSFDDRGEPVK